MNIRFFNANIVPFRNADAEVILGELWVSDDKIVLVGEPSGAPLSWDREIDCRGNLLLPGFKNAHTHSAMTFLRSFADDKPLLDWLNEDVFPLEKFLTGDDIYTLTTLAIMEYVSGGTTAAFDMYYQPDYVTRSAIDTGFRMVLCGSINDFGGTKETLRDEFEKYNKLHPLISQVLGFHAEYTTSKALIKDVSDLAHELCAPVFTHNSETKQEVEGCKERYGMSPTKFLDSLGMFDFGGGGFHCVHFTDEDTQIFKSRGLYAVTNCGSNVKLASGIPPVEKWYRDGVKVAIGTDGPASNNCLDFFREMFLVTGLQKLEHGAASTDANLVLHSACSVGADAMGLSECNSLDVGKQADLIMIDMHRPNMQPVNNMTKNVVYSGSKENVALTMIRGKVVYENGRFVTIDDPEDIYRKSNAIIARIRRASGR